MGFVKAVTKSDHALLPLSRKGKSFNTDKNPYDKSSRLDVQLRFFGFKKKRFISVYAKKPRIIVRAKVEKLPNALDALVREGVRRNGIDYIRCAHLAQQQHGIALAQQSMGAAQSDIFGHGFIGGLGGIGLGAANQLSPGN